MMRTELLFLLSALHLASATYFNYDASLSGTNKCALVNVVIDESGTSDGDRTWMKSVAVPEVSRLLKEEGFHNIFACINEYGSTNNHGCTEADGSGNVNTGALETWENQATAANGWQMIQEAIQDLPSVINEKDLAQTCGIFVKTMYFMTDMTSARRKLVSTKQMLSQTGYTFNVVSSFEFGQNGYAITDAVGLTHESIILKANGVGEYNEITSYSSTAAMNLITTSTETLRGYAETAFESGGAAWSLQMSRSSNPNDKLSLTDALANVGVAEMAQGISDVETGTNAPTPSDVEYGTNAPTPADPEDPLPDTNAPTPSDVEYGTNAPTPADPEDPLPDTNAPTPSDVEYGTNAPTPADPEDPLPDTNAPTPSDVEYGTNAPTPSDEAEDGPIPTDAPTKGPSGSNGDPHFKTWKSEHFEYHGQCDMILAKDDQFADGIGFDVQIRTKVIRYWSYIKSAAIRIGDDILEVEGGADSASWWFNLESQGKIGKVGGFPVNHIVIGEWKQRFEIDLSSKFPGQKIVLSTFKEFVRVDFDNGTEESFGNSKGLLGDFKTGQTLARDGSTVMNDFWEYGNEWQVLPFEYMLFHETSHPQFPERCTLPEDPRGDRRRRLAEASVTEEQAEAACAQLKDPLDRKDCVYDVLATQDIGMVGAY